MTAVERRPGRPRVEGRGAGRGRGEVVEERGAGRARGEAVDERRRGAGRARGDAAEERRPGRAVDERRPGRPRSEAVDEAILDATVDLLSEQGFIPLTIEAVAARACVAKTTIYRRWSNKDDLLMEAVACMKGPPPSPPGESVREDLLFMLSGMRDAWFKGRLGRIMGRLAADGIERPDIYRQGRDKFVRPRQAVLRGIIQRGIDEGSIRADVDPEWVISMICSPVIAAALTHQDALPQRQVEFILDTVLKGVAP